MGAERNSNHVRSSSLPAGQEDRRGSQRYGVVEDQAWLGWWDGPSFVTTPCRILDISLRGALLQVETMPTADQSVWFCPPGTPSPEWLEASLIPSKRARGQRQARVAFRRVFPYQMFKTLVYGRETAVPDTVEPSWTEAGCDGER